MTSDLHEKLSTALQTIQPAYAKMLADSVNTEIKTLPTPFLAHAHIYEVTHFARHKPILFYVGDGPQGTRLITGQPSAFAELAQADGTRLESEAQAAAYARLYVHVTRPLNALFYIVEAADDVRFRPQLEGTEAVQHKGFLKQYASVIHAPQAVREGTGYTVTLYAVREQQLERLTVRVDDRLQPYVESSVIEAGLPLVYGL